MSGESHLLPMAVEWIRLLDRRCSIFRTRIVCSENMGAIRIVRPSFRLRWECLLEGGLHDLAMALSEHGIFPKKKGGDAPLERRWGDVMRQLQYAARQDGRWHRAFRLLSHACLLGRSRKWKSMVRILREKYRSYLSTRRRAWPPPKWHKPSHPFADDRGGEIEIIRMSADQLIEWCRRGEWQGRATKVRKLRDEMPLVAAAIALVTKNAVTTLWEHVRNQGSCEVSFVAAERFGRKIFLQCGRERHEEGEKHLGRRPTIVIDSRDLARRLGDLRRVRASFDTDLVQRCVAVMNETPQPAGFGRRKRDDRKGPPKIVPHRESATKEERMRCPSGGI